MLIEHSKVTSVVASIRHIKSEVIIRKKDERAKGYKKRENAHARFMIAAWLYSKEWTLEQISAYLYMNDHSAAGYALEQHAIQMERNPDYKRDFEKITKELDSLGN